MHYKLSVKSRSQKKLHVQLIFDVKKNEDKIILCLPRWRPGRYELGNFIKNLLSLNIKDAHSKKTIPYQKAEKDIWHIHPPKKTTRICVDYVYYCKDLNAGSSYIDADQVYINPVNCLMYIKDRIEDKHTLELLKLGAIPIACAQKFIKKKATFDSFHQLADTPFVISKLLKKHVFEYKKIRFYLWFMGECKPDLKKIERDFKGFIVQQLNVMKSFVAPTYHFLFQITPYPFYHGVEHLNSTVIALGPGYDLMNKKIYDEFLGVSSHELFHAWNIKNIRPKNLLPYKYNTENYFRLGYVAEGVTTYYGDLFLKRSGYFSNEEFLKVLSTSYQRYQHNGARFTMSIAQASFDTWVDGYVKGSPHRKISIYNEGMLFSLILDFKIRKATKNKKSLDDVLRTLYISFGKKNKGYEQKDMTQICEKISGLKLRGFFQKYIYNSSELSPLLKKAFAYYGLKLIKKTALNPYETFLGIKISESRTITDIHYKAEEFSGLEIGDQIMSINHFQVTSLLQIKAWMHYFNYDVPLGILRNGKHFAIKCKKSTSGFYFNYQFVQHASNKNYKSWVKE